MAISYSDIDVVGDGSATKEGIDIGTDEIVLKENLAAFEERHLELALAESALSDYTMPNGKTADVFFAPYANAIADIQAQTKANTIRTNTNEYISGLEERIVALEP